MSSIEDDVRLLSDPLKAANAFAKWCAPVPPMASHFGGITPVQRRGYLFVEPHYGGAEYATIRLPDPDPTASWVCAPPERHQKNFPLNLLPSPSFESVDEHISCALAFNGRVPYSMSCDPGWRPACWQSLGLFTIVWT